MPNPPPTSARIERFLAKTQDVQFCGCRIWLGGSNEHGYGVFWNGARLEKAHRFALRAEGVEVPDNADVLHKCDVPACVNPNHLFVGDAQANVEDMWKKSRATVRSMRGAAQAQAKLTDDKADEIRALWRTGRFRQRDLAAKYGVSQRLVWNVIHGKNWANPTGVVVQRGRGK